MLRIALAALCLAMALETQAQITVLSESGANTASAFAGFPGGGNQSYSQSSPYPLAATTSASWTTTASYYCIPPFPGTATVTYTDSASVSSDYAITANSISASGTMNFQCLYTGTNIGAFDGGEEPGAPVGNATAESTLEVTFSLQTPQSYTVDVFSGFEDNEGLGAFSFCLTDSSGSELLPCDVTDGLIWSSFLNPGTYTITMDEQDGAYPDPYSKIADAYYSMDLSVTPVPEPSTFALLAVPLVLQGIRYLRNRRRLG